MKYIKFKLDTNNIYLEKEFNTVKELNDFILELYFNNRIKRTQASELLGISLYSVSQLKYKWKQKHKEK